MDCVTKTVFGLHLSSDSRLMETTLSLVLLTSVGWRRWDGADAVLPGAGFACYVTCDFVGWVRCWLVYRDGFALSIWFFSANNVSDGCPAVRIVAGSVLMEWYWSAGATIK